MNLKNIPVFDDKIRELMQAAGHEQALPGMNERIMNRIELTTILKIRPRYKPVLSLSGWIIFAVIFLGLIIFSYMLTGGNETEYYNTGIDTKLIIDRILQVFTFPELTQNVSGLLLIAFMGILIWISLDFILNSVYVKMKRHKSGN